MRVALALVLAACGGSQVARVPPPSADARPTAVSLPPVSDALDGCRQHSLEVLNGYRAQAGVAPLVLDATLTSFAQDGSRRYARDRQPHAHMRDQGRAAFRGRYRHENQGPAEGVPLDQTRLVDSCKERITELVARFMERGAGEGHHDAVVDPRHHLLGVGLYVENNLLWITNDLME